MATSTKSSANLAAKTNSEKPSTNSNRCWMQSELSIENTALWKSAFNPSKDKNHKRKKDEFRRAFLSFHDRAQQLANQIHVDHPSFTVHDITHIDALREPASLGASEDFALSTTEGLVL